METPLRLGEHQVHQLAARGDAVALANAYRALSDAYVELFECYVDERNRLSAELTAAREQRDQLVEKLFESTEVMTRLSTRLVELSPPPPPFGCVTLAPSEI